jgi:hypothetical protein
MKPLVVAGAHDLGLMFEKNPHKWSGRTGRSRSRWRRAHALVLRRHAHRPPPARGQSLWTIDGKPVGPRDMTGRGTFERMINNTALVLRHKTGGDDLTDFKYITDDTNQLRALIPLGGDEHPDRDRIWCQHGIALDDGKVVLSFIKVRMLDEGPLPVNFEIVGSGLAVGSSKDWIFHRVRGENGMDILWSAKQPHFATAFLDGKADGFMYCYGTVKEGDTQNCYVARVQREKVDQPSRYEYLTNCEGAWSRDVSAAIAVFSGMPSELSGLVQRAPGRVSRGPLAGPERQDRRPDRAATLGPVGRAGHALGRQEAAPVPIPPADLRRQGASGTQRRRRAEDLRDLHRVRRVFSPLGGSDAGVIRPSTIFAARR